MSDTPKRQNSWLYRRIMGYAITAYAMTSQTWLMWEGEQGGELHKLMAEGNLWILFGVFMVYVAGATADDLVSLVKGVRGVPDTEKK